MRRWPVPRASLLGLIAPLLLAAGARRMSVTEGKVEPLSNGRMRINGPKVRAVLPSVEGPFSHEAELRFTYLGPSQEQKPLQSGELRRQVGLKLRARDGCNVVYVMWRMEPKAGLWVSVKSNPELHTSEACGNQGYQTVKPGRRVRPLPALEPGVRHTLRARLQGAELEVQVDGQTAWTGTLPDVALTFDGPVGLRTDNGRFDVELLSSP